MRTAVCYYSRHHGNTRKVLEAMAREGEIDLIDATVCQTVRLEDYDCVGFASGVYFGSSTPASYTPPGSICPMASLCSSSAPTGAAWDRAPGS